MSETVTPKWPDVDIWALINHHAWNHRAKAKRLAAAALNTNRQDLEIISGMLEAGREDLAREFVADWLERWAQYGEPCEPWL